MVIAKVEKESTNRVDGLVRGWVRRAAITGRTDSYEGKRQNARTSWSVPVVLRLNEDGFERILYTMSRDVSLSGLGVVGKERLPVMTQVEIWVGSEDRCVMGRVMHCTQTIGGYVIGIEFDLCADCGARKAG